MKVYAGMDGGATKTAIAVIDRDGREMARHAVGAININSAGRDAVRAAMHEALEWLGQYDVAGICIGAAGLSASGVRETLEATVRECGYSGRLKIIGDQDAALAGAIGRPEGLVLISGTGSVCCGRLGDRHARSGGWGYKIDDVGSGYAIGCAILSAAVRAADLRGAQTCLTQLLYDKLAIKDMSGLIGWIYAPSTTHRDIAALSRLINPACEQKDAVALGIIRGCARGLFELVQAAYRQLCPDESRRIELALLGSVLQNQRDLRDALCSLLMDAPNIALVEPRGDAAMGAASFARE